MIDRETQSKMDAGSPELYSMMTKSHSDDLLTQEVKLETWLPLIQRFLSVTVTPLLERTEILNLNPAEFIEAPFTWTIAHHLFGVDVRKAHTERAENLLKLLSLLELTLDESESRIKSKMSTSLL
jgi:hypothetical protein